MLEIGRFVSADTIVPEAGRPQSFNRYAYVTPPINWSDPTGHCVNHYAASSATCVAGGKIVIHTQFFNTGAL